MLALSRRFLRASFVSLSTALFAGGLAAQTVTVGPFGSGAMYGSIAAAIAAAPPGGTVLIAAGHYHEAVTLVVDKPLTLLGAGSASTTYHALIGSSATARLPLLVTGLSSGQQVLLAGLRLVSQFPLNFAGAPLAVSIQDCAGPVVLADVVGIGAALLPNAASAGVAQIRDSTLVTIDRCSFVSLQAGGGVAPLPALRVERALVHVNGSTLTGADAPSVTNVFPAHLDGSPGVLAIDATLRLARSVVRGGLAAQAYPPFANPTIATRGGAGVQSVDSEIFVRGGAGNQLRGGRGGTGLLGGVPLSGPGGAAIHLDATSLGATTPDVDALPGPDGNLAVNTPAIDGPGAFAPLAFPLASAAATATLVAPGGTAGFALGGEPGALTAPFLALAQAGPFTVPGMFGLVTLDLSTLASLPLALLDAAGAASIAVALPPAPTLVGVTAHVQAITFGPGGWVSVSGPTAFAIR